MREKQGRISLLHCWSRSPRKDYKQHVAAYPILNGKLLNTVIFISDPEKEGTVLEGKAVLDATNDEIAEHFVGWEEDVQVLIKVCNNLEGRGGCS